MNTTTEPEEEEIRARHEANRAAWNEGAVHYTSEIGETAAFIAARKSNLHPIERQNLGDLRTWCQTAIHLQCASGRDTLSLINEGVREVIGVDISDVHIENARKICEALEKTGYTANSRWHRCDVLDVPHELDGWADLVYTGRGALCWLHDITRYADVVFRLLKPGGVYHILDDHPVTNLFDEDAETFVWRGAGYFEQCEASTGWPGSYIGEIEGLPVEKQSVKYERNWTLMEITNALIRAGFIIEYLGEHTDPYWDRFPNLKSELQGLIPLTFSIKARKKM
jgi:SAM-dependent methyltransferase